LKLTTDKHEASRGLSATAELLVYICICSFITFLSYYSKTAFLDCLHESFVLTVW